MRTPETLTAAQRAARLKLIGRDSDGEVDAPTTKESSLSSKNDRYRDQARESLLGTPRNATANLDPKAEANQSFALLNITDIEPYRYNPRTLPNPQYEQIKASIRADGITNMLTVTRAPGAAKYSPYGGGNTRLKIARELLQDEGDRRFERLHVLIIAWPGEAAVISAHLAENENRGDISFWEKAKGVAAFKREFELASGRALASNELNKELKQLGVNYGIKMIQNFAFAVEYLEPVGPWLRSTELNEVLRPSAASLLELGSRFDRPADTQQAFVQILQKHAGYLISQEQRNEERDDSDRVPVALDAAELMADLQAAVANALQVEPAAIGLMASTLAQNPRIDAESLRRVKPRSVSPPPASMLGLGGSPAPQVPLAGMLAPVPRAGPSASAPPPPPTPSSGGGQSNEFGYQPYPLESAPGTESPDDGGEDALQRELDGIHACLLALNELVPLWDMVNTAPAMPFGYLCDFPPDHIGALDGQQLPQAVEDYRIVLWKLLVILSGQLNHDICKRMYTPATQLRWLQALSRGPEVFAQVAHEKGHSAFANGDIYAAGIEFAMLFSHELVAPAVVRLLSTLQRFRARYPQRFPTEHVPLFSKD